MIYYQYNVTTCPVCGGRIKHPYTGMVTSEQLDEDFETCLWMEVVDEGRGTLGYTPICKKDWVKDESRNSSTTSNSKQ